MLVLENQARIAVIGAGPGASHPARRQLHEILWSMSTGERPYHQIFWKRQFDIRDGVKETECFAQLRERNSVENQVQFRMGNSKTRFLIRLTSYVELTLFYLLFSTVRVCWGALRQWFSRRRKREKDECWK